MSLVSLGWNDRIAAAFAALDDPTLAPARVAREDRDRYLLLTGDGEVAGVLAGRLRHEAGSPVDLPAVGDWVGARIAPGSPAVIAAVLPRSGAFVRGAVGGATAPQVVAANVDAVFVVAGLDVDFNPRRIERYLVAAWDGGAAPVLVLNKSDLAPEDDPRLDVLGTIAAGVPVVRISALQGTGVDALAPWLVAGSTVALLGTSGVGKSTLANALLGESRQATGPVRASDSRGRHTTTARELIALPGGALLLDTPGMRVLQLWSDEDSLGSAFPEIEALAAGCRFNDCSHAHEPGCAVLAAEADGSLPADRLAAWRKLQRELQWLERRRDALARIAEEARWRTISRSMKHHPKADRWRRD